MEFCNDEYYKRYTDIQKNILQAYIDIFCLQEIETYNKPAPKDKQRFMGVSFVLDHFYELLKTDLCLSICRVYTDKNDKSNTIQNLLRFVKNNCKDFVDVDQVPGVVLDDQFANTIVSLKSIRDKSRAHSDVDKEKKSVQLSEMIKVVEALCDNLNSLCFNSIHSEVHKISKENLDMLKTQTVLGLGYILRKGTNV